MHNESINVAPILTNKTSERIDIALNSYTYDIDPVPENNWVYHACRGFEKLQKILISEGKKTDTFATIGTGPGVDAIGAQIILHPTHIIATDLLPNIVECAEKNIRRHLSYGMTLTMLTGNLCEPLEKNGLCADVIYANLPLIPTSVHDIANDQKSSTYMQEELLRDVPIQYQQHLLGMYYLFLQSAKNVLTQDGSVVVIVGGRVPIELIQTLFSECGYSHTELWNALKVQTQPEEVLAGFAKAEQEYGTIFDFYRISENQTLNKNNESAKDLKEYMSHQRVSATEALTLHKSGVAIGHVVHVIRGQRIDKN